MTRYSLLILMFLCNSVYAEGLAIGRLFTSPSERANLDYLRQTTKSKVIFEKEGDAEEQPVDTPAAVSMQGYIKRSDGKSTVWINNKPMQEGDASPDVQVGKIMPNTNLVPVVIPGSGKVVGLKAGQVYVPDEDKVLEVSAHAKAQAKNKSNNAEDEPEESEPPVNTNRGKLR